MSGELIARGDPRPLPHLLPPVPTGPVERADGRVEQEKLENAVAQCARCGYLFVSRVDPDGWGRHVYWTRLRWWHRKAWAKVRVEEARRIGGVAP